MEMKISSKLDAGKVIQAVVLFTLILTPTFLTMRQAHAANDASLILAQTGQSPGEGLIPELSTSYYDTTVASEIFSGLALRNDTTFKTMIPQLASGTVASPGWSVTSDNKNWTVTLRSGVTWHDGQAFTATDVKFTFDSLMNDTLAAPTEAFVVGIIGGKANVVVVDSMTVGFNLPLPYAYFVQNVLTTAVLPSHILKDIPYNSTSGPNWRTSSFNTGQGSAGPIGTGPYKWVDYNPTTSTVHLTRNDNYFDFPEKGKSALVAKGQFTVKDYYVKNIIGTDAAITALTNGEVNVLDSQYHMETQPNFLKEWGNSSLAKYDAFGVQEMGVNMEHPVLGTGANTPLGQSNPSQASVAARYVRQAISYAVPRDQIISQLLNGYGNPAITTPVVGNYRTGTVLTEGFNTALTPYPFNLTKAKQMLQAAGYTLPTTTGGLLTPNLRITLLVPTSNSARRAWATIVETNLRSIGIDASRVELPFSPNIFDRALTPAPSLVGKTYDQGGFDILFVGYNLGIDADPWSLYDSSQFAPTGGNYYLWNNSTNDNLVRQVKETVDKTTRLNLVKDWQVLAAQELPSIPILYTQEIVAFDKTVTNGQVIFQSYHAPAWPPIEHLTVTSAQPTSDIFATYLPWIAIAIVAVVVIVGAALLMRSRKKTVPTSPSAMTSTTPP